MKCLFLALVLVVPFSQKTLASEWVLKKIDFSYKDRSYLIRVGYLPESQNQDFKGNIIYYQGLGDSMLNHNPLFEKLTSLGFRVLAFDYLGQGGSEGSMNDTRIDDIHRLGLKVWDLLAKRDCLRCEDINIIGWSTGGLAAYRAAYKDKNNQLKRVVLLSPALDPKYIVGKGIWRWPPNEITRESYTSLDPNEIDSPFVDPISPKTPMYILNFSTHLLWTAWKSDDWKIPLSIKGLALLADPEKDLYVKSEKAFKILKKKAPSFEVKIIYGARHELDNEVEPYSTTVQGLVSNFMMKD